MYNRYMRKNKVILVIQEKFENVSLVDYLLSFHCAKSYINNLICSKKVKINEKVVTNHNEILYKNDIVEIELEAEEIELYEKDICVIYEDDYVLVVNKPSRILVHTDGNTNETLTNAVANYLKTHDKGFCAYPIHRLDYETTGIVVFAKDRLSLSYLSVEVERHNLEKEYVCLCHGQFQKVKGEINKAIGKDRHSNRQIICNSGKVAETKYEVLKNGKISKVKVIIKHGRKHQIRVHLKSIGHEIVGDKIYGNCESGDLKLHFRRVVFTHPYTRKITEIICEEDF